MNLSSSLTGIIPAPRFRAVAGSYGYTDVEAIVQNTPGSTYWSTSGNCQRYYTSSVWGCNALINTPLTIAEGGTSATTGAQALINFGTEQIAQGGTGATTAVGANASLGTQGPVINVLGQGVVAGGTLGSSLSTDTANTTAIQTAINLALATQAELYFPCGVYNINGPLTVYGQNSIRIVGQAWGCAILQYTGSSPITQGMLTVAGDAPATNCTSVTCDHTTGIPSEGYSGFQLENMTLVGNADVPDNLDLLGGIAFSLKDNVLIGASTTGVYCMLCQQGYVGDTWMERYLFQPLGFTAPATENGFVLDGVSPSNNANEIQFNTAILEYLTNNAIWIRSGGNNTFSTMQDSTNLDDLQIDVGSGNSFTSSLFEGNGGSLPGTIDIANGVFLTTFNQSADLVATTIAGSFTRFYGGALQGTPTTIASTASSTLLDGTAVVGKASNITDNSNSSEYRGLYDTVSSAVPINFPSYIWTPGPASGGANGIEFVIGTYQVNDSSVNITPGPLAGVTGAWQACFHGYWVGPSGYIGTIAQMYCFTTANPSVSLGTGTATITASTDNRLVLTTSGSGGNVTFSGSIEFYPSAPTLAEYFNSPIVTPEVDAPSNSDLMLKANGTDEGTGLVEITGAQGVTINSPNYNDITLTIGSGSGSIVLQGPIKMTGITSGSKAPLCINSSGQVYLGNNTGTGAPCP
jgi:hypothetical protein